MYVNKNWQWKILHHPSCVLPEGIAIVQPVTEQEVKGLFDL